MKTSRMRGDRGATAVLMALCIVGLLAFGGLVMDGGNAFSQRRQMQNAADASATAGANALYRYKLHTGTKAQILTAVRQVAQDNGADPNTVTCKLVSYSSGGIPNANPPDCQTATDAEANAAWTVRVTVNQTTETKLMKVVNIHDFTASGDAAASLIEAAGAASPFMICGAPGAAHDPDLLVADATDPTGWRINPLALNREYDVWGNPIKDSDCGYKGSSFRGLVDDENTYPIPGTWPADSGNKGGNKLATGSGFVGGCDLNGVKIKDIPNGCEIVIPICSAPGADKKSLHCVAVGRFRITSHSTNDARAIFLGAGILSSGAGGGIPTSVNDALIIKLTE